MGMKRAYVVVCDGGDETDRSWQKSRRSEVFSTRDAADEWAASVVTEDSSVDTRNLFTMPLCRLPECERKAWIVPSQTTAKRQGPRARIRLAMNAARDEVSKFSSSSRLAGAMAGEGYAGGYVQALSDALLALEGVRPNTRNYWNGWVEN